MLDDLIEIIEKKIIFYEQEINTTLNQIKNSNSGEICDLYFEKIFLMKVFLDSIYLSFDEDIKNIMNQRIGKKTKLINILKDFDRIDDEDTRKYLQIKIKEGYYD